MSWARSCQSGPGGRQRLDEDAKTAHYELMLRGLMLLALPALLSCSNVLGYDNLSFEDAGPSGTGGASTGGASTGGASTGGASSGGTTGGDPFAAQRQACVDTINQLRATKSLQPLQRWTDGENCADLQATDDNKTGKAHGAWSSKKFGCDGGSGQNECLGGGITGCLNSMWNEKDKAGCAGCDQCTGPGGCTGCDFYGSQTGDVCGHYVNMSAKWFTKVACGFSSAGNWAVQNYK